jgi:hypothetical protein
MNQETRKLLEDADKHLERAYLNVRIAISDLRDDKAEQMPLQSIFVTIDKAKVELEKILEAKSVSDIEIFEFVTDGKRIIFSEANH